MNPGNRLNIMSTGNCFNVGIGRLTGHTDYSMDQIVEGYSSSPYFCVSPNDQDVRFRVYMNGKTTSTNTKYPRVELRELNRSKARAAWNGGTGTHIMQYTCRVLHLPPNKSWVCFGQIHDGSSDLVRLQTEGAVGQGGNSVAIVARWTPPGTATEQKKTVIPAYTLGMPIVVRFEVINGVGKLYVNEHIVEFPCRTTGCFFKAGAYSQSNTTYDLSTEYCEVEVVGGSLIVWHTGYPGSAPAVPAPPQPVVKAVPAADSVHVDTQASTSLEGTPEAPQCPAPEPPPEPPPLEQYSFEPVPDAQPAQEPPTLFGRIAEWFRKV